MFYLDKNTNMNEIITLEEAEEILTMAKRLYPGFLNGIFVDYADDGYAFCRNLEFNERYITLFRESNEELEEMGEWILNYVNEEFDTNFAVNLKTITIQAFCHELGHAIDFEKQKMLNNFNYEENIEEEYNYFYRQTRDYYWEIDLLEDYMNEYGIDANPEVVKEWKRDIEYLKYSLDYDYRQITSEYAADKFSAYFMKTHLRYIPQLFEN